MKIRICPICQTRKLCPEVFLPSDKRFFCAPCSMEMKKVVRRVLPSELPNTPAIVPGAPSRVEQIRDQLSQVVAPKLPPPNDYADEWRSSLGGRPPEYYKIGGINLYLEMEKMLTLEAFGGKDGKIMERGTPILQIRRAKKRPRSRLGWCRYSEHKIHITIYPKQLLAAATLTVLHELSHLCSLPGARSHTLPFARIMAEAIQERWGLDLTDQVYGRAAWRRVQYKAVEELPKKLARYKGINWDGMTVNTKL